MPAKRCSICSLSIPGNATWKDGKAINDCPSCDAKLDWIQNEEPDPGWEALVSNMRFERYYAETRGGGE